MHDIYLYCLLLGGIVLIVQILLGLFAGSDSLPEPLQLGEAGAEDGLDLLSVRTIAAGTLLFGATGLWLASRGMPTLVHAPLAAIAGVGAAIGTAYLTRQILKLESDGSLRLENAVGESGTVYLPVPAQREGYGMIQLALQGRTVELRAVSDAAAVLPTGAAVIVVALLDGDTVEVTPTPLIEGIDT